jgi:hypothetical protein
MHRIRILYLILLVLEFTSIAILTTQQRLIQSNPSSNHIAWTKSWGGIYRDYSYDAVFVDGALFVTGASFSYGPGPVNLILLKYNQDGELAWNETYSPRGYVSWRGTASTRSLLNGVPVLDETSSSGISTMGRGAASDGASIYICGIYIAENSAYSLLLKYDLDGRLIWEREWRPEQDAKSTGVALDEAGNIYVTGYVVVSAIMNREFLLKYNSGGDLLFSMMVDSEGTETAWGISVSDAVYLCGEVGYNTSSTENPGLQATSMLLTRISLDGNVIWSKEYTVGFDDVANSVDAEREISVAGYAGFRNGTAKAVLLRYDPEGDLRYSKVFGEAPIEDMAWGIAMAGQYTYVVGHTRPTPTHLGDASVCKLGPDGDVLWWDFNWGDILDRARAVTVSGDDIYVVGETYKNGVDMQVLVKKFVSPNNAMSPELSRSLKLSPLAIGCLLLIIESYMIIRIRRMRSRALLSRNHADLDHQGG